MLRKGEVDFNDIAKIQPKVRSEKFGKLDSNFM